MKIVDAYWEKRNLGVSTTEFTIENNDKWEDIENVLANCDSDYQVLRLPCQKTEMVFNVQKHSFLYVEDMVTLKSELNTLKFDPISKRLYKEVSFEKMNESDIEQLRNEIKKGLFYTDRVYLDPFFDNMLAFDRYINWVNDEYDRGALFYKFVYKQKTFGFSILKKLSDDCYDGFLGGLYKDFQKGGFGNVLNIVDIVKALGGSSVVSNVSSNNFSQIKNLITKGYYPLCSYHIFVKHKRGISKNL